MGGDHSPVHGHLTLIVLVVEVVGSLLTGSLALLADAGHVLTDAAGIGLALLATRYSALPSTTERTYGYLRAEMLAAVVNAVLVLGIALFIVTEAVRRWNASPDVDGKAMLAFGIVALVANAISLALLHKGRRESLNVRGAYLEVMGDLLGSVAVIVAAIVIATTGYSRADQWASLLIAALIVPRAIRLLTEALDVLMEATPKGMDLGDVRRHILAVSGVAAVHDLHAWTITSGVPVLSAHVVVDDVTWMTGGGGAVLDRLGECLAAHFDVEHCTFQIEPLGHTEHEASMHP